MTRPQVIINLHGGLVQDVFCSVPGVQVLVVDWDVEGSFAGDPASSMCRWPRVPARHA